MITTIKEFKNTLINEDNLIDEIIEIEEALNTENEDDVNLSKELKDKLYIGDFH